MQAATAPKKILIVSPTPTHPQTAGNRARIHALIGGIQALGHEAHFLHIRKEPGDDAAMRRCWGERYVSAPYRKPNPALPRWRRKLGRRLGLGCAYTYDLDEWYDPGADAFIRRLADEIGFDVVIVEYVFFSKALLCFGASTLKVLDTHDVFTNRHRRYLEQNSSPMWYSTTAREEARGLNRADIVVAIQANEAQIFRELCDRRIVTVGHVVPLHATREDASSPELLYVGSGNDINVHAVNYFIHSVLPEIRRRIPEVLLTVAGGVCDKLADHPGVRKLGQLDDLAPAYAAASVVVNPVLFGTGLKVKTVEALGFAKPLVTTPMGAEGLDEQAGQAFLVAESAAAFSEAVSDLLLDREARMTLSKRAFDFAADWNRRCMTELAAVLDGSRERIMTAGTA